MKIKLKYCFSMIMLLLFMGVFLFTDTAKAEEGKIFEENGYYYYDYGDGRIYDINHKVIYQLNSTKKAYTVVDYPLNVCYEAYSALAQYDASIQIRPDGNVVIADTIKGKKVTAIAEEAFNPSQNPTLISVKIGKNVTSIGKRAFVYCTYLKEVTLPDSLKKIGEEAFYQSGITSITIGKNVNSIGKYAFSDCKNLESVTFKEGVLKSLPLGCFWNCTSLKSVILPSNITKLGEAVFGGCKSLENAVFKGKLTSVSTRCFENCISLKSFQIPSSVTTIKESAFYGCGLETIQIPSKVKKIEALAFYNTKIEKVFIPSSVTTIGDAFLYCENLYQVVFTKNVKKFDCTFRGCDLNRLTIVAPKDSLVYKTVLNYEVEQADRHGIPLLLTTSKKLSFDFNSNLMYAGEERQFRVLNCSEPLKWKSSKSSVLKITKDGKATAKKAGTVTITAYSDTQKYTFKIKVLKRTTENVMKVITNEFVRPELSDYEKVKEAFLWLEKNVKYDYDTFNAVLGDKTVKENLKSYSADGAFENGLAVCSGYAAAFQKMMNYYEIPCDTISECVENWQIGHAWNAVQIKGKWYFIDTTSGWSFLFGNDDLKGHYGFNISYKLSDPKKVNKTYKTVSANSKKKAETFKVDPYLNATKVTLVKGGDTFTIKLEGAKVKSFTSKNKKVATVSKKGVVTAKKKGTTTIVVKTTTGKTYSCKITVDVPKLNKTKLTLNKGKTYKLKLSGTKQKITWKSSNTKVAMVTTEGKVIAVGKGTAKITATVGGKKYTCKVTVKNVLQADGSESHVHEYAEKVIKTPTCTTAGEKKYTCSCGDTYTKSIEKLGHNYQWDIVKNPSEAAAESSSDFGERDLICQNCKDHKATEIIINIGKQLVYGYFDENAAIELIKEVNDLRSEQGHTETIRNPLEKNSQMMLIAQMQVVEEAAPFSIGDTHIACVEITRNTEYVSLFIPQNDSAAGAVSEMCVESDTQEILLAQEATSIGAACFYMQSSDYDTDGNGGTYLPYWVVVFETE